MGNVTANITRSAVESILGYAKACYPNEAILLLKGKAGKDLITINEVEIPPLAVHGNRFANFPLHMLPVDFSIIGSAHSHPSGFLRPSTVDLNHFYGRIMIIVAYPYSSEQDMAIFNGKGESIDYKIIEG